MEIYTLQLFKFFNKVFSNCIGLVYLLTNFYNCYLGYTIVFQLRAEPFVTI